MSYENYSGINYIKLFDKSNYYNEIKFSISSGIL